MTERPKLPDGSDLLKEIEALILREWPNVKTTSIGVGVPVDKSSLAVIAVLGGDADDVRAARELFDEAVTAYWAKRRFEAEGRDPSLN